MEIVLVLIVLAVIAAAAFLYMRSAGGAARPAAAAAGPRAARHPRRRPRLPHDDPMAEAVERHAQATDPHEARRAELRLQAQASRVAADLHARQAGRSSPQAGGRGLERRRRADG